MLSIKTDDMNKKEERFQPQEAPRKNTDKAFVRGNKDGSPSIPEADKKTKNEPAQPKEQKRS